MRRYGVLTKMATALTAGIGLATFGLTGSASAAASVGAVHDLAGEYNLGSADSWRAPRTSRSPQQRATWWARPAPSATPQNQARRTW
jgi:hypothetical protein